MKLVITTIGQNKIAIVESEEKADEKKGERYISEDCLKANLNNGTFIDVSDRRINPEGRIFVFHEDLV